MSILRANNFSQASRRAIATAMARRERAISQKNKPKNNADNNRVNRLVNSERLNRAYQLALQSTTRAAAMLRSRMDLTARQRSALQAVARIPAHRATVALPAKRGSVALPSKAILSQVQTALLRMGVRPPNPRSTAAYHAKWLALGAPQGMPVPFPYSNVPSPSHKWVATRAAANTTSFTVTAGQSCIIGVCPLRQRYPVRYQQTTAGSGLATAATDWSRQGVLADRTYSRSAIDWNTHAPHEFWQNADCIKSGQYVKAFTALVDDRPVSAQNMFSRLKVSVAVPWDGSCIAECLSPGDSRRYNHGTEHTMPDRIGNEEMAAGTEDMLLARHPVPPVTSNLTPREFAQMHGKTHVQMGGGNTSNTEYVIHGLPMKGWAYCGELDATDAPAASLNSSELNLFPRDSIAAEAQFGFVVLTPSGADCTVTVEYECVNAYILENDSATSSIPSLAAAERELSESIMQKVAQAVTHMPGTSIAPRGAHNAVMRKLGGRPVTSHPPAKIPSWVPPVAGGTVMAGVHGYRWLNGAKAAPQLVPESWAGAEAGGGASAMPTAEWLGGGTEIVEGGVAAEDGITAGEVVGALGQMVVQTL